MTLRGFWDPGVLPPTAARTVAVWAPTMPSTVRPFAFWNSLMADLVERLCTPPLTPIRRLVPLIGGVDLSPLVLLVLLQVAAIVLGHLQGLMLLAA